MVSGEHSRPSSQSIARSMCAQVIPMSKAFKQADREAYITLGLYVFFFLWWTLFAFGLGTGDPEEYSYVFGLPAWFFYSCVAGYPVVTLILWVVVRKFFADIPLDASQEEKEDEEKSA